MMKKLLPALLAALFFTNISCSCTEESFPLSYESVSDPTYSPEGMSDWGTYAFVFSSSTCTSVRQVPKLSSLKGLDASVSDKVAVVALESDENVAFSTLYAGNEQASYKVLSGDFSPFVPKIWAAVSDVASLEDGLTQILKPVTAQVCIDVKNAPENFVSASLNLSGCADSWRLCDGMYSDRAELEKAVLVAGKDGAEVSVFPFADVRDVWTPELEVMLGEEVISPSLEVEGGITSDTRFVITLDFSTYEDDGTFRLEYRTSSIMNPYSSDSVSQTVFTDRMPSDGNRHYRVTAFSGGNWTPAFVADALCSDAAKHGGLWNDWANTRQLRDTMSYAIIDTEFPAKVRIKKYGDPYSKVVVRPSIYGIEPVDCGNGVVEITIPDASKGKLSIEYDGDRYHNLFIYANEPDKDKPTASSSNVRYFGPGEHNPGTISLYNGQTLYIDYGAVVYANVVAYGSDVTIAGHGVLSGEKMKHWGDNLYSYGDFLMNANNSGSRQRNFKVKDITMIDSPGWNMIVSKIDGVEIDGVNMISWELNGDGIDIVCSTDVDIRNCFLRTYDDCLTLKCRFIVNPITDVHSVTISDCLIWADYARGIVVGPEAGNLTSSGSIHDIEVKDCIFLHHKRSLTDDLRSAFAIGQGSDGQSDLWTGNAPRTISNVYAHDLVFDNIDKTGRNVSIWQYGTSSNKVSMSGIRLENFRVIDNVGNNYPAMNIKTRGSSISGLNIRNFTVNGKRIGASDIQIDYPANVSMNIE